MRSWRVLPIGIAIAGALAVHRGAGVDATARDPSDALARALAARGLTCEPGDVTWLRGADGILGAMRATGRALVRAAAGSEPHDLYLVEARLSPEGRLLSVEAAHNLTATSDVDEPRPIVRGLLAAYAVDGSVHALDLAGHSPAEYTDFTRTQMAQAAITNLQQTGQTAGVLHHVFGFASPNVTLAWRDDATLEAREGARVVALDARRGAVASPERGVRAMPDERARPPALAPWAVDRLRAVPWIGEEGMQFVKAIAFTGLEWAHGAKEQVLGDKSAAEVAEDLEGLNGGERSTTFTDPALGWPPAPMTPLFGTPLKGEGEWIALDKDAFITPADARELPPAFVTSFVRTDPRRPGTRIYATLWDPRQIALHMEAGTVEPQSSTGARGPGIIPRRPEVMKRLVGAFNGGFQALHGEFGMQAGGVLYLPPKPYAATVLELADGSAAFGAWPPGGDIPKGVTGFRQNLTALVENDRFNPWGRTWWGGTPKGWSDSIHTTRSGVCLTKEGFAGYFYGLDVSPEALGKGMLAARCTFGIHLDMNPGLAGFELYNVKSKLPALGRALAHDWEAEGAVDELPDLRFRARRMVKSMQHMNFPQYIHRGGRDFFYLTRRALLPGPALGGAEAWRVTGLPQHGFPWAVATAALALGAARATVVRIDPRLVQSGGDGRTVAAFTPGATTGTALVISGHTFSIDAAPAAGAVVLARGAPEGAAARAACGVRDDGTLEWIELAPDAPGGAEAAAAMLEALEGDGCSARMLVLGETRLRLGGTLDAAGAPAAALPAKSARLVRAAAPGARPMFADTPIVPERVWQPLQAERARQRRAQAR